MDADEMFSNICVEVPRHFDTVQVWSSTSIQHVKFHFSHFHILLLRVYLFMINIALMPNYYFHHRWNMYSTKQPMQYLWAHSMNLTQQSYRSSSWRGKLWRTNNCGETNVDNSILVCQITKKIFTGFPLFVW